MIEGIIAAAIVVGVVGLILGILINLSSKFLFVQVDEREEAIRECLPGNNCGACGFSGCDGYANALAKGEAPTTACPVGGAECAEALEAIVGGSGEKAAKKTAFVKCNGTTENTTEKFKYSGSMDCVQALIAPGGGSKQCQYSCLGFGTCVTVCDFDAIHVIDGVAVVDQEACVSCGKCVDICPKNIIDIVPYDSNVRVACSSHDKGKDVNAACKVGCIACRICEKQCEFDAIHVIDNLAIIDYEKCTMCGKCAEKCPKKIINI